MIQAMSQNTNVNARLATLTAPEIVGVKPAYAIQAETTNEAIAAH
jgi:hypothetical protein